MGETVAIMGASGAGKSTLLGLLAGLDLPTSGNIWLKDCDITKKDEDSRAELRARNVGFIFQSFHLLPSLNAIENVMLPLELADSDRAKERAREILKDVGLGQRLYHYPSQLSGGEKQRVSFGRALLSQPNIILIIT